MLGLSVSEGDGKVGNLTPEDFRSDSGGKMLTTMDFPEVLSFITFFFLLHRNISASRHNHKTRFLISRLNRGGNAWKDYSNLSLRHTSGLPPFMESLFRLISGITPVFSHLASCPTIKSSVLS
jgi:hypothetical protein